MQELQQRAAWDGKIFVDGAFRAPDGGGTLTVLDKAAQEPLGTAGVASAADLDAAARAAKAAQPGWAAEPYDVRAAVMRAAAAELQRRADEVATCSCARPAASAGRPSTRSAVPPTSCSRPLA
jgi:aldehyde dehydrogenase (NAD+)